MNNEEYSKYANDAEAKEIGSITSNYTPYYIKPPSPNWHDEECSDDVIEEY